MSDYQIRDEYPSTLWDKLLWSHIRRYPDLHRQSQRQRQSRNYGRNPDLPKRQRGRPPTKKIFPSISASHSREINLMQSAVIFVTCKKGVNRSICPKPEYSRLHIFFPLVVATFFSSLPHFLLLECIITVGFKCRFSRYALPKIAKYMLKQQSSEMEKVPKKYYQKTSFPTVYGDGMILNPHTKLIIFEEESWADTSAEEYSNACRRRFIQMYDQSNAPAVAEKIPSSTGANKRSAAHHADPEYRQVLLNRSSKRRRNDYDRYIEIPNDPDIPSASVGGEITIANTRIWEGW